MTFSTLLSMIFQDTKTSDPGDLQRRKIHFPDFMQHRNVTAVVFTIDQ